jgi:arginase family enzyme
MWATISSMEAILDQLQADEMTRRVMSYSKLMDIKTFSGVATFFRSNFRPGLDEVDVALLGVPTDLGLTQRSGARHGPREIRNQSCNILYYNPLTKVIPYEAKRLLQGLRGLDVVGCDIVEVSPPFDSAGITALAGAQLMYEMLCLAAESFAQRTKR